MGFLIGGISLVVGIGLGIFIGILIGTGRMRKAIEECSIGNLRIDRSEPDEPPKPYLEVEKGHSIEKISREKFVILQVINESYISQN